MRTSSHKPAMWWLDILAVGTLLIAVGVVLLCLTGTDLRMGALPGFPWRPLLGFGAVLLGTYAICRVQIGLELGYQGEHWPVADVERVRRLLNHPSAIAFAFLPTLAWLASAQSLSKDLGLSMGYLVPLLSILRLRVVTRPMRRTELLDRVQYQRAQSEHWGDSGHATGDAFPY